MKTVFISHATKDKEIIDAFVDVILVGALSVTVDKIFCVSTDGMKIKSGEDWRNSINESLKSAKINFLIITPNYKESEVCMNEMGAAWVTSAKVIPLIVDPINYKSVGVIQEPNQIEKLIDENSLDRIKDTVQEVLQIPIEQIKSDRWTVKKREFLSRVKKHINANPFSTPMDRMAFEKLEKENKEINQTMDSLVEEKTSLEKLVEDLKKAKDKDEVIKVIKKHKPNSDFDDFEVAVRMVKKHLLNFKPIIRGIIFKEFTGKDIKINWEQYRDEIDEAVAEDFITEDFVADWKTTEEMAQVYNSLSDIREILERRLEEEFHARFADEYNAPMKIDNKKFWEEVFTATIFF